MGARCRRWMSMLAVASMCSSAATVAVVLGSGVERAEAAPVMASAVVVDDLVVNDIVYDQAREVLYASVAADSPRLANRLVTIDPDTAEVVSSAPVGTEPSALALTADGDAIYIGLDGRGAVQKFDLPGLVPGWSYTFGTYFLSYTMLAGDIEVMPGTVDTIAVSRRVDGLSPSLAGVIVVDGGVPRPTTTPGHIGSNSIVFGDEPSRLYGSDKESTLREFQRMVIDGDGITEQDITPLGGGTLAFHDGLVYSSDGRIVDPIGAEPVLLDTLPWALGVAISEEAGLIVYTVEEPVDWETDVTTYSLASRQLVQRWSLGETLGSLTPAQPVSLGGTRVALLGLSHVAAPGGRLMIVDLVERPPDPYGELTPLTPERVLDTRTGNGRDGVVGPLGPGQSFEVQITGRGGVAADGVSSVVMNVTAVAPTASSYLVVWPSGVRMPETSNLNYLPGQTVPNLVTVAVGDTGRVSVFNAFGSTHVLFDVVGFYADTDGPAGSRFHSLAPSRLFDTRTGAGGVGTVPLGPDQSLAFDVLGRGGVPVSGVTAVLLNVTAIRPTATSYLTVYPGDVASPPTASNLNYVPGLTVPNLVVVRVPATGIVRFHNAFGDVHVLADVVGYYDADRSTQAGRFIGFVPERYYDSRWFGEDEAWGPDEWSLVGSFPGLGFLPLGEADAVLLNVTAARPTETSYLTVFPSDNCSVPMASNLNFTAGRNVGNQVVVGLGPTQGCAFPDEVETISIYNAAGRVHVIVDIFGIFTSASTTTFDESLS